MRAARADPLASRSLDLPAHHPTHSTTTACITRRAAHDQRRASINLLQIGNLVVHNKQYTRSRVPTSSGRSPRMSASHRSAEQHGQQGRKMVAPAAERNKQFILEVLARHVPPPPAQPRVLEIASGSGQHCAHFASALPHASFQPSERAPECLDSISAYIEGLPNALPPLSIDTTAADWGVNGPFDTVIAINITHISPWEATLGLLQGAAQLLSPGGALLMYGPFAVDGKPHTPGNVAFDERLRSQNPAWGYRDIADVSAAAEKVGLALEAATPMPADNFMLVLRKAKA